jgi:DNA-binding winged helix-turn-helix (wHTH) protein/Flp pilus assembly protein TadD
MGKIFQFGNFTLNTNEQTLSMDNQRLHLPTKEFEILLMLVENNGQLLTKDEIMKTIWAETFVEESNLAQYISRLRKILNAGGAEFIKTFSKRGYRFSAEVNVSEATPSLQRQLRLQISEQPQNRHPKIGEIRSLAVLPFQLLGFQTDEEFLGLGITDALITQLSRLEQVLIRPTRAILKYVNSTQKLTEIAGQLGVDAVLQGNFQKIGNRLRLTVQMFAAQNENVIWAEVFNAEILDIFAVQDEIAGKIANSFDQKLSAESQANLNKRFTDNVEAYQEYLRGRFYLIKREVESLRQALRHFEKAVGIEPLYALPYTGIAQVYLLLPLLDELSPHEAFPRAKAAILRALEIDPNLAEAHTLLGIYLINQDWNWPGAEISLSRALQLNPNSADGHQVYATFLLRLGRIAEAIVELNKAKAIDPLSPVINTWLAEALSYLGEYEASILLHQETLKFSPNYFVAYYHLTLTYLFNNQPDKAIETSEQALKLSAHISLTQFSSVLLLKVLGNEKKARQTLKHLEAARKTKYISASNIASCYAAFQEKEETLAWLTIALEEKDPNITWIKIDREYDFLRNDESFHKILAQVNLVVSA